VKRILFVDDEPLVLDGLRDLLRRHRKEWDMSFVNSIEAAVNKLRTAPFDVIVTDIRMPGMDGAALLAQVMNEFPQVVRIVLSGQSGLETAFRTVSVAHQFLSKPCDAVTLENTINRACNLRALIHNEKLLEVVGHIDSLPSQPHTYVKLVERLRDEHVSAAGIAEILEQDMAMSVKLLQLVNSAFFGMPRRIHRIEDAVTFLGQAMIRDLVLSVSVFSMERSPRGIDSAEMQRHAMLVGNLAMRIADGAPGLEDAFLAGMTHDMGILLMASKLPGMFGRSTQSVRENPRPLHVAEAELLGVTHAELGAYLLGLWGFADPVVEAVAFHHRPTEVLQRSFDMVSAVHIADVLAQEVGDGHGDVSEAPVAEIDPDYVESLGVRHRLDAWRETARTMVSAEAA
jgi:HD-like signal output (HDOD) protein